MAVPKVKISFDADFDELKKGVKGATDEVEGFGDRVGNYAGKVGAAFAVAGAAAAAYAGKLLIDGVKSAIEDEAQQAKLATTLKNVAGATSATVAQVEAYILKTELATGKTDGELRPSFERFARATGDVNKAMALQQLAMDVSAGSGKDLQAVTEAISKSYEGNNVALGKLGLGIDKASLKSMTFDEITAKLSTTFEGQASKQADTFQGKIARISVAFDEAKETVGAFVIDAITPLMTQFTNHIIPTLGRIADIAVPAIKEAFHIFVTYYKNLLKPAIDGLRDAFAHIIDKIQDNMDKIKPYFELLKTVATWIAEHLAPVIGTVLGGAFKVVGELVGGAIDLISLGMKGIVILVNGVIDVINLAIKAYNLLPFHGDIALIQKIGASAGTPAGMQGAQGAASSASAKGTQAAADLVAASLGDLGGGTTSSAKTKAAKAAASAAASAVLTGLDTGMGNYSENSGQGIAGSYWTTPVGDSATRDSRPPINLTVNGALDPESVARQIVDVLNTSFYRGTGGAGALVTA